MLGNVCDSVLPVSHIGPLIGSEDVYSRFVLKFQAYNRLFIYADHTNTRINTPWLSSRCKQGGIAVKNKLLFCIQIGQMMKKGLSWPHIHLYPAGVHSHSLDMWGRVPSTIFRSMYLRRVRQSKRDVLQHKEMNVLHLMEKRMFWAALPCFTQSHSSFIPLWRRLKKYAPFMQLMCFPGERFIYDSSSRVADSHLASNERNTETEPFSLLKNK